MTQLLDHTLTTGGRHVRTYGIFMYLLCHRVSGFSFDSLSFSPGSRSAVTMCTLCFAGSEMCRDNSTSEMTASAHTRWFIIEALLKTALLPPDLKLTAQGFMRRVHCLHAPPSDLSHLLLLARHLQQINVRSKDSSTGVGAR
jgi:hypothetical protein